MLLAQLYTSTSILSWPHVALARLFGFCVTHFARAGNDGATPGSWFLSSILLSGFYFLFCILYLPLKTECWHIAEIALPQTERKMESILQVLTGFQ